MPSNPPTFSHNLLPLTLTPPHKVSWRGVECKPANFISYVKQTRMSICVAFSYIFYSENCALKELVPNIRRPFISLFPCKALIWSNRETMIGSNKIFKSTLNIQILLLFSLFNYHCYVPYFSFHKTVESIQNRYI